MPRFRNRSVAGAELGSALQERLLGLEDPVVLGLPRGGVPVASEVARALGAPLDVFLVRKLGAPGRPELAMGAIASGGVRVLNPDVLQAFSVTTAQLEAVVAQERAELERREVTYRGARAPVELHRRSVVLVDDGLATGATMRAAVTAVRLHAPAFLVVAVPTGAADSCTAMAQEADAVVCLHSPEPFSAVGAHYGDFRQTSDEEVRRHLGG